jgi:DNA polymerase elongation subunit (family B)
LETIFLVLHYLINAEPIREGVKLIFFNPSTNNLEEVENHDYKPYFFIPHPINRREQETIEELNIKTKVEEKKELFTDQMIKVTQVELDASFDSNWISERFAKSWEGEVPHILSYAYDTGLIFGTQHHTRRDQIEPVTKISEKAKQKFEERFSEVSETDPEKYELLERLFHVCSQPVPEINPEKLGIRGKVDTERYYLAFMLSRVANLPVYQAYTSNRVSEWIKSLLHNHLRRNNILIPTARELRRGETKRRVQGALTFPPEAGVHFNTIVVDFESLYPSLIDSYNLSHETIDCPHVECQANRVPGLEHHVCRQRRGIYSVLIGALKDLRIHWFKPLARDKEIPTEERVLAQATSQLLKLILVSCYGVTIRILGLARPSLGESITAYGRYSLQSTWDIATDNGLHPIYGDTDSLFLDKPDEEEVDLLIQMVKERLRLDLAVDERYSVCMLPRAMKAYFGIRRNGTPDIKGVTAIKSNSPQFIQEVFRDCVKEMVEVKNLEDFEETKDQIQDVVRNAIFDLKEGRVSLKDLVYSVELHEDPEEKIVEQVFHQPYQCALQLIDSGKRIQRGDIVRFVKVRPFIYRGRTFTVKPTEQVRNVHEVNVEDYVRNLRTALNQTFEPMDLQFGEEGEGRVTLSDFF